MLRDELKKEILSLGSDNIGVFGGEYEGGINLQQRIDEIVPLIIFLERKVKNADFLEIGSASGGNTFVFNKYLDIKSTTIIDDNNHPKHNLRKDILKDIEYDEFVGNSQSDEAIEFIKNKDMLFDIIFIDGDHSYDGVRLDTLNYVEFLKPGGFVIFHDTVTMNCRGIVQWMKELTDNKVIPDLEYKKTFYDVLGITVYQKKI